MDDFAASTAATMRTYCPNPGASSVNIVTAQFR